MDVVTVVIGLWFYEYTNSNHGIKSKNKTRGFEKNKKLPSSDEEGCPDRKRLDGEFEKTLSCASLIRVDRF
jgi:hypothetical protein